MFKLHATAPGAVELDNLQRWNRARTSFGRRDGCELFNEVTRK